MPLKPILDTNIFGDISVGDRQFVLRHRPRHGWPLSAVTAMELLAGIHEVSPEKFLQRREQIELACQLSKRRILEEPRFLLCKEVLHVPFPSELVRPSVGMLRLYMEVVRRAKSLEDILEGRVPFPLRKRRAGFTTSVIRELVAGPKREWLERLEAFASGVCPQWRQNFEEKGKRLTDEKRKELESRQAWDAQKLQFGQTIVRWLAPNTKPELVAEITKRLDAVFEFTIFVCRQFAGNYNPEKHESDIYDQFQLHYLALDRLVIVSADSDLSSRTVNSHQAPRIMSLEKFLHSL